MREIFENQACMISYLEQKDKVAFERVDKNGTRIYRDYTCDRCGGSGVIPYFGHVDHGICFACRGTGRSSSEEIKVYTDEYGTKLLKQRAERKEKKRLELLAKSEELNKEWLKNEGFNAEGTTFIVLGNTYDMKEELKAAGAKYNELLGWHMADPKEYDMVEIEFKLVTFRQPDGLLTYDYPANVYNVVSVAKELGERRLKELRNEHISQHIGQVGERRKFECELIGVHTYHTSYSYYGETNYIYKFKDENGDIVVWYTTSIIDTEKDKYVFTATIKEHSEYKGENQTVISRAKFS